MYWYWWVWIAFVIFVIFMPLGYGWGYRGWGPPYPGHYYRSRRLGGPGAGGPDPYPYGGAGPRAGEAVVEDPGVPVPATSGAWGIAADLFWLAVLGAVIWAIIAWAY